MCYKILFISLLLEDLFCSACNTVIFSFNTFFFSYGFLSSLLGGFTCVWAVAPLKHSHSSTQLSVQLSSQFCPAHFFCYIYVLIIFSFCSNPNPSCHFFLLFFLLFFSSFSHQKYNSFEPNLTLSLNLDRHFILVLCPSSHGIPYSSQVFFFFLHSYNIQKEIPFTIVLIGF